MCSYNNILTKQKHQFHARSQKSDSKLLVPTVPKALRFGAPKRPKKAVPCQEILFLRPEKAPARSNEAQARLEGPLPGRIRGFYHVSEGLNQVQIWLYLTIGAPICTRGSNLPDGAPHDQSTAHLVKETPTCHCALGPALA